MAKVIVGSVRDGGVGGAVWVVCFVQRDGWLSLEGWVAKLEG